MAVQGLNFRGLVPNTLAPEPIVTNDRAVRLPESPENFVYLHRHRPNDTKSLIDAYTQADKDNEDLGFLQRAALKSIGWYQKTFRTLDENGVAKNRMFFCQCTPSCSSYTAQAIREDGAIMGSMKGLWRICVTCNPIFVKLKYGKWNVGSGAIYDPVKLKPRLIAVPDPLRMGARSPQQAPWADRLPPQSPGFDPYAENAPSPWAMQAPGGESQWGMLPPPEAFLPQPAMPQLVGYSPVYAYPSSPWSQNYGWDANQITQNGFDSAYASPNATDAEPPARRSRWNKSAPNFKPSSEY